MEANFRPKKAKKIQRMKNSLKLKNITLSA